MPSWSDLQENLNGIEPDQRGRHIAAKLGESVAAVANRHLLYYASSLLQKP